VIKMEKPTIGIKDYEILKWHCAGKRHSWIAKKFNVSREYIDKLIRETSNGYEVKREITIRFFGDAQLTEKEPLIWFPNAKVACDFSECGQYIAQKHIKANYKHTLTTLDSLIKLLTTKFERVNVKAENNGISRFFKRNNIKTLRDLTEYFNKSD